MPIKLLFVDDEPDLLAGIRRGFKRSKDRFSLSFAESGAAALEWLDQNSVDVIVSDMRMPGMDGAQFLSEVRLRHPEVVRFILSGYSEEETVMRTVGPAHQYLAKPCDIAVLVAAIERAVSLRKILDNEKLSKVVSGMKMLPTLPKNYEDLMREIDSEQGSVAKIATIISRDVSMSAQVLKITNSAFFGLPSKITNVERAVHLVGFDTIRSLTLMLGIFDMFPTDSKVGAIITRLVENSLSISSLVQAIGTAENMDKSIVEQASCAAVLSHVGTLVLIHNWSSIFEKMTSTLLSDKIDIITAERRVFNASHCEIGAYLLALWGFSFSIVEAVAYHHEPMKHLHPAPGVLTLVYAAQYLAREYGSEEKVDANSPIPDSGGYMDAIGYADRWPQWRALTNDLFER